MPQIFPRSANWVVGASIVVLLGTVGVATGILLNINRLDYVSGVNVPLDQPVPFSHLHHVTGVGLDCRYCHTTVEEGAFAGIPPTETCMTCHSQLWTEAPMLAPVRASFRDEEPLQWTRVHDLPDFVYFDHSIHVSRGIGCETCHGPVDEMPLVWKENTLNMEWCLECHRHPEKFMRPVDEVFNMSWEPPPEREELGRELMAQHQVEPALLTDCAVCHR